MTIAKKVLLALADYLNVKGIQGVAEYFEEDKNKFYAWSKRGVIADTGVILGKCPEIRKEWLETGEGEMLKLPIVSEGEPPPLRMVVTETRRAVSEQGWELLDCFDRLCKEQQESLLIVARTMAAGVPAKSPEKERKEEGLPEMKSGSR
jgi:hypothetical protein